MTFSGGHLPSDSPRFWISGEPIEGGELEINIENGSLDDYVIHWVAKGDYLYKGYNYMLVRHLVLDPITWNKGLFPLGEGNRLSLANPSVSIDPNIIVANSEYFEQYLVGSEITAYIWRKGDEPDLNKDYFSINTLETQSLATPPLVTNNLVKNINDLANGSIQLSGNFTEGEVIGVDGSGIIDPDNMNETEPWDNMAEVAWEITEDGGLTWSELNDADTAYGKSTLHLTAELVGKQVRASYTFTDFFGSREQFYSDISSLIQASNSAPAVVNQINHDISALTVTSADKREISAYQWQRVYDKFDYIVDFSDFEIDAMRFYFYGLKYEGKDVPYVTQTHVGWGGDQYDVWSFRVASAPSTPAEWPTDKPYPSEAGAISVVFDLTYDVQAPGTVRSKPFPGLRGHYIQFTEYAYKKGEGQTVLDELDYTVEQIDANYDGIIDAVGFKSKNQGSNPLYIISNEHDDADFVQHAPLSRSNTVTIPYQTSPFYIPTVLDLGKQIVARVQFEGDGDDIYWNALEPISIPSLNTGLTDDRDTSNHSVEGELLVVGTTETGQTISVDTSSISDTDDIDSNFSYSWQVLDIETNTWKYQTSPDATDGNASYTLTNDDEGKRLRARISYVDGNGSNKTLSSESFFVRTPFPAGGSYQSVITNSAEIGYRPGGSIHFPLIYNASSDDANLSGLTLNIHYDSTLFAPEGADHGVSGMIDAAISTTAVLPDTDNLDNDSATDRMVQVVWASFDNSFPNQNLPFQLATVTFKSLEDPTDPIDPLTGSRIHFTSSGTASGYDFLPSTTTLTPRGFDLDVDGNGAITALGDGLMIIRKLFGPAFAGDKLTDKAISPNAIRTSTDIHDFIQDGITAGDLDVDQDGKTTALGDGLMIIRYLFGATFSGDALTSKALSPDSAYANEQRPWEAVAANIDELFA